MKFEFMILEPDGKIDTEVKEMPVDKGFAYAGRFLKLFVNDPHGRVARVMMDDKPLCSFDSEKSVFTVGSSHLSQKVTP